MATFNRREQLYLCLRALLGQSHALEKVIVIDNASTDGTLEAFQRADIPELELVEYVRKETNTGGAGGFNHGMDLALTYDCDWIWVMDDDVAPEVECLESLLKHAEVSECIHPRRLSVDGSDYGWEQYLDVLTGARTQLGRTSFAHGKPIVFTNVACFEGMLVSRRVVELVGLPDAKYFIVDDDTVFGVKASTYTNVALVEDAVMRRLLPPAPVSPWKSYYMIRNAFFLHRDACEFLDLKPTRSQQLTFVSLQLLELGRLVKRGRPFVRPALSGFRDGLHYLRGYAAP